MGHSDRAESLYARAKTIHRKGVTSAYFRMLERAASVGSVESMFDLACYLEDGFVNKRGRQLLKQDRRKAVRLYCRAVAGDHTQAMINLAACLSAGRGAPVDDIAALKLEKRAARLGNMSALMNIGISYRNAGKTSTAVRWFHKAARHGDDSALLEIAKAELYGVGTRRDVTKALERLARVARSNVVSVYDNEQSCLLIARCYLDGWLVRRSYKKAIPWLRIAVATGSSEAKDLLAWLESW
jgi:TPR repeat protein